jgi:hypothetical protein
MFARIRVLLGMTALHLRFGRTACEEPTRDLFARSQLDRIFLVRFLRVGLQHAEQIDSLALHPGDHSILQRHQKVDPRCAPLRQAHCKSQDFKAHGQLW